jgi:hypothetical protein
MKDRKVKQVLSRNGYQWEGIRKEVKEGKYGRCILYSYMKIKPVKIVLRRGRAEPERCSEFN